MWFDRLLEAQNEISAQLHAGYVGQTVRVLVDGESGDEPLAPPEPHRRRGRLVHLAGDRKSTIGQYVQVRITDSNTWALFGEVAEGARLSPRGGGPGAEPAPGPGAAGPCRPVAVVVPASPDQMQPLLLRREAGWRAGREGRPGPGAAGQDSPAGPGAGAQSCLQAVQQDLDGITVVHTPCHIVLK